MRFSTETNDRRRINASDSSIGPPYGCEGRLKAETMSFTLAGFLARVGTCSCACSDTAEGG